MALTTSARRKPTNSAKVEYKKLAQLAGMGNPTSANNAWLKIKKKLQAGASVAPAAAVDGDAEGSSSPVKATPKKRTKKDAAEGEPPAKKSRARGKGKVVKPEPEVDGEVDGVLAYLGTTGETAEEEKEVGFFE